MARHVVLLGNDASLATTLRTLLGPDDRLAEVDGVEGWQRVRQGEIDAVVVDLPSAVRLQVVDEVRSTYGGRLILLYPADDPLPVPSEYDCLVIKRPDVGALWRLATTSRRLPTAPSEVAEARPTADTGSVPAPTSRRSADSPTPEPPEVGQPPWMWRSRRYRSAGPTEPALGPDGLGAAGTSPVRAEEGGVPTPKGQPPSVPTLPPSLENQSTNWDSILLQTISAERPVILDASQIEQLLSTARLQEYDREVPQSAAAEVAKWLRADVVVLLLDNGQEQMEVFGGVGLTPADWRLTVEYSHDVMRELFRTSIVLIEDTDRVHRKVLAGIPGSRAQTLLMAMLVHDHSWIGVLIAARNRSQTGVPTEVFTDADIRTLIAVVHAVSPSLHAVVLLRRIEQGLKAGENSMPAEPGPATVAEAGTAASASASMSPPGPYSTPPVQSAQAALSAQSDPARAPQAVRAVDTRSGTTGRAAAMLSAYLIALAAVDLTGSSPVISVPVAVMSHGLLALLLCVALRMVAGQGIAVLVPPLVAISVARLVTLGALPVDVSPLTRLVVVGVLTLVAVAIAARQRSPEWRLLRPLAGGWPGQLVVGLVGIPSALVVWAIAPPSVEVRGGASTMVAATVLVIFAALPEELLYRGLLVPAAAAVVGPWGVPFASATYALAYVTGGSITTVLLAFLLGLVLGWCRQLTGSVVGVIGAHSLLNVIVYLLLPDSG
jgi:membrane protease YdiL (CAAX protease family)